MTRFHNQDSINLINQLNEQSIRKTRKFRMKMGMFNTKEQIQIRGMSKWIH